MILLTNLNWNISQLCFTILYSLALMVRLEGIMVRVEELQEQAITQQVSLTTQLLASSSLSHRRVLATSASNWLAWRPNLS